MQECRWTTSQGYAAESARDALQRDTFKVGIALLRAVNSSADHGGRQCILACMPRPYYITLWCAHGLDSEFAKLFQQNLQKPPFAKM